MSGVQGTVRTRCPGSAFWLALRLFAVCGALLPSRWLLCLSPIGGISSQLPCLPVIGRMRSGLLYLSLIGSVSSRLLCPLVIGGIFFLESQSMLLSGLPAPSGDCLYAFRAAAALPSGDCAYRCLSSRSDFWRIAVLSLVLPCLSVNRHILPELLCPLVTVRISLWLLYLSLIGGISPEQLCLLVIVRMPPEPL